MNMIQKKLASNRKANLSHEEVCALIDKAQAGCMESRNIVIERNLGLCVKYAGKGAYIARFNPNIDFDDCFQESIMGLIRAIELFDTKKNIQFSTYAFWWIQQVVMRYIDNNRYAVRTPVYALAIQSKFNKIKLEHEGHDEEFYINLVAFELDKSPESIKNALSFKVEPMKSLDVTVNDSVDDGVYVDAPIDRIEQITFTTDTTHLDAYYIKKIAELLPKRDMEILMLRMDNWGLSAIGEMVGLSRERVRQIENRALIKLRALVNKVNHQGVVYVGNVKASERKKIYPGNS